MHRENELVDEPVYRERRENNRAACRRMHCALLFADLTEPAALIWRAAGKRDDGEPDFSAYFNDERLTNGAAASATRIARSALATRRRANLVRTEGLRRCGQ